MKPTLKKLLALVLVISSILAMTSCSLFVPRPPRDLEKVKAHLENAGCATIIKYVPSGSNVADSSCTPIHGSFYSFQSAGGGDFYTLRNDVDEYITVLHLTIVIFKSTKSAKLYYEQIDSSFTYSKQTLKNKLEQLEFTLKHHSDDLTSEEIAYYEKEIERVNDILDISKEYVIGRSGKMVWFGQKDWIKAAKTGKSPK